MADDARVGTVSTQVSRHRLNDLWQEREHARQTVADLRWIDYRGSVRLTSRRNPPQPLS